jgi:hypothetical protein
MADINLVSVEPAEPDGGRRTIATIPADFGRAICVRLPRNAAMKHTPFKSRSVRPIFLSGSLAVALWLVLAPPTASAQKFEIKSVAEKKVSQLPDGPLFWRIDNFPSLADAQAAAGPTGLPAEVAGKDWLFTLGPKGGSSPGGSMVAEIGPVPAVNAPEYLLRINNAAGPPGVKTPVHTHPGTETFYVLTGQLSQKSAHGVVHLDAGHSMPGHAPGMPMEVSSSGTADLDALVMFVVDASRPFSSPATMP